MSAKGLLAIKHKVSVFRSQASWVLIWVFVDVFAACLMSFSSLSNVSEAALARRGGRGSVMC